MIWAELSLKVVNIIGANYTVSINIVQQETCFTFLSIVLEDPILDELNVFVEAEKAWELE